MKSYARSQALFERAQNVLAGGVSSEFRKYSQPHPLFYERARGSRIWDVDGNEYVDFTLSQGPLILGHGHPHVLQSVCRASEQGQLFAGQQVLELELAERLQRQGRLWNEQQKSDKAMITAHKNMCKATLLAVERILRHQPNAVFFQNEAAEAFHEQWAETQGQVRHQNELRFLTFDTPR